MRRALGGISEQYAVCSLATAMNMPLVGLLLCFNLHHMPLGTAGWGYLLATILGYYQLPLLIASLVLCVLLTPTPRLLRFGMGGLLTAFVLYLLVDCVTYRVCRLHVDLFWTEYVLRDYAGLGLPPVMLPAAGAALVVVAATERRILILSRRWRNSKRWAAVTGTVALLAFTAGQAHHIVAYDRNDDYIRCLTPYLPFYLPFTSHNNADKVAQLLIMSDHIALDPAQPAASSVLHFPAHDLAFASCQGSTHPNIVIILLECWRHDMLDSVVTPNITTFAQRAIVFTNHLSSGNSTTAGLFGLFYGLHPTYWPAVKANSNAIVNPPLIDAMTDRGYTFGVFADSNFKRHKIMDTMFQGIDVHESFAGRDDAERDADMLQQVLLFLDECEAHSNPYMLFAFFKASHTGYRYPPDQAPFRPSRRLNPTIAKGADADLYINDYRNALHYDDRLVGAILQRLERHVLSNTIVLITSDHGESFNDNQANEWGHGTNFTRFQVQVPLVLYIPGHPSSHISYRTSHIDVAPTLLREAFGCLNETADYSNGRDLLVPPEQARCFVVGSYVNHAYVIGEDTFAIFPMYTQKYQFSDYRAPAGPLLASTLRAILRETSCFYAYSN